VNYLAHAQLIDGLLGSFTRPARIVLVGSSTYYANWVRRLLMVPAAGWTDPLKIARPAGSDVPPTLKAAGVAYSNSKLAILYYAHELQRRVPEGINVTVFEPGFMPGTGLSRQHRPAVQRMGRGMQRLPWSGFTPPAGGHPGRGWPVLGWSHPAARGLFEAIKARRQCAEVGDERCGWRVAVGPG
jgi:NAD(P)-dependent dehydrogenase (short-subunit alcohol dehydrogenase family)